MTRVVIPKHDVFISFIHEEEEIALAVKALLERDFPQRRVFLAYDLLGGNDWLEEIRRAISSAKVVVLLLSRRSVRRPWINFEAGAGWLTKRKTIIPVIYGGLRNVPEPYGRFHWIDLKKTPGKLSQDIHKHFRVSRSQSKPEISIAPIPFIKAEADPLYAAILTALSRVAKAKAKQPSRLSRRAGQAILEKQIMELFPAGGKHYGYPSESIAKHFNRPLDDVKEALESLRAKGRMHNLRDHWYGDREPEWSERAIGAL